MRRCLILACTVALALPASAAQWVTISRDKGRQVEVDRSSVLVSDAGAKVAWGRILLSGSEASSLGYSSVKSLNRYDCRKKTFASVRRIFFDESGAPIREEELSGSAPIPIPPGSINDTIYKEVCQPASFEQLRALAGTAAERAEASTRGRRPPSRSLSRADLKLASSEEPVSGVSAAKKAAPRSKLITLPPKPAPRASESAPVEKLRTADPLTPRIYPAPARTRKARHQASSRPASEMAHFHGHWGYEGETGPQNWAKLSPEYVTCGSGTRQSPIDIRSGIKVELDPIRFDYKPSYFRIIDNGHTIQASVGAGLKMSVMGRSYELQQIHFHRPSEERIDGRAYDMVAHLVHKDLDGRIAVVAVLIERGSAHPLIQTLWNNLPLEKNDSYAPSTAINPADLLPSDSAYYTYMGSLTTPPCTEGVLWMVMKQPVQLSDEQIAVFSRFYRNNARPVQPVSGRTIKESR